MIHDALQLARYASAPPMHGEQGEAVRALQVRLRDLGIPVGAIDGIAGDMTRGAWAVAKWRAGGGRLWWWETRSAIRSLGADGLLREAERYGVDHVAMMTNGIDGALGADWKLDESPSVYCEAADALHRSGIGAHLCPWVVREAGYLHDMCSALEGIADAAHIDSVQWDAESPWYGYDHGMSTAHAAEYLQSWAESVDMRTGCTGYVYAPNAVHALAERCDYGVPQAYSQYDTGRESYTPGGLQSTALRKWRPHTDHLVMGLGAYRWSTTAPGWSSTPIANLYRMIFDAVVHGVRDVSVWSGWWVRKDDKIGDAFRVLGESRGLVPKEGDE